jgi:hypothetical protein
LQANHLFYKIKWREKMEKMEKIIKTMACAGINILFLCMHVGIYAMLGETLPLTNNILGIGLMIGQCYMTKNMMGQYIK